MDRKAACRRGAHCAPGWMSCASQAAGTARLHDLSRRVREGELPRNLVGADDSPNVALEQWERCGYTIHPVGREKVNCRAAAREAGLGHDSARRMCQFITGRKCRCARQAHYDSLRAAAKRRLLACTLAAAREEGALRPLLRITPARGCPRVPATANKFVHILWKNLICDNVAAARFCA